MFGALGRVRAAALPTARKMGGVRWGHAEYPAEVKVRVENCARGAPAQLFSAPTARPHLSPLTLARAPPPPQALGSRMIAEATVVGFFFAFWWRISHSQEKARYDAYYKALRAEKAEE